MPDRTCSSDRCPRPHYALGLCTTHYQKQRRAGTECSVDRCDRVVEAGGLCNVHYNRNRKYGDPEGGRSRVALPPRHFSPHQVFAWYRPGTPPPAGTVWPWLGYRTNQGYGAFRCKGVWHVAHRVSFEIYVGPIPAGHIVRHKNDVTFDVNPNNIETGTNWDNTNDMMERERNSPPKGVINGQHKLTESEVIEIFFRGLHGESHGSIAKDFPVCRQVISRICARESWKHVTEGY